MKIVSALFLVSWYVILIADATPIPTAQEEGGTTLAIDGKSLDARGTALAIDGKSLDAKSVGVKSYHKKTGSGIKYNIPGGKGLLKFILLTTKEKKISFCKGYLAAVKTKGHVNVNYGHGYNEHGLSIEDSSSESDEDSSGHSGSYSGHHSSGHSGSHSSGSSGSHNYGHSNRPSGHYSNGNVGGYIQIHSNGHSSSESSGHSHSGSDSSGHHSHSNSDSHGSSSSGSSDSDSSDKSYATSEHHGYVLPHVKGMKVVRRGQQLYFKNNKRPAYGYADQEGGRNLFVVSLKAYCKLLLETNY